jgi:prepilin signal peptidase PulO-like enzyme (type II secretory pathway)
LVPDLFVWLLVILVVILQLLSTAAWSLPILAVLFSTGFFLLLAFVAKKILRKDALGLGDVKLMIPLSFLLSWPKTVLSIFLAFIIGGIFAMLLLLTGKKKVGQAVPFAPFLIVAAVVSFVYGEAIWQWYLGFLL